MTWLRTAEAADYAKCSVNSIRDAAERGDLSGVKLTPGSIRSQWRFTPEDIDAWLESGRVVGGRRPRRRRGAA